MPIKMLPYSAAGKEEFLKIMNPRCLTVFSLLLLVFVPVHGQLSPVANPSSATSAISRQFMPLSAVKAGMRGTARTVFSGTEPEDFVVEILGVVPGAIGPKQDLIVGRISGGQADRTAVFAGMSGSPVYVDGKLVGAISYSFPFSKEPICGITPIEQMIGIFERRSGTGGPTAGTVSFSFAELASTSMNPVLPDSGFLSGARISGMSPGSPLSAVAGHMFRPIGIPVTFTGIRQESLNLFAPLLERAGLVPVAAVGGTSPIAPIKKADSRTLLPGTSVSMHLTRGDYSLAAAGTVTLRDGDRIYAFGHPFLSLGSSDLPMSESSVVTVIPSVANSFKLAVPGDMVGTMTQDRATGVFGMLGRVPRMIPVRLNVETSRGRSEAIELEVARDEFLTPLLLNIAIYNAIVSQERSLGDLMVSVNGEIRIKGQHPIRLFRRFSGSAASQQAAGSVAVPMNALLRGRFEDLAIEGIVLDLRSVDGSRTAMLERIAVDRSEVRAGETIEISAFARATDGRVFVERIPLTLPNSLPPGPLTILVGDGGAVLRTDATQHFVPGGLSEFVEGFNRLRIPDRLYIKVMRSSPGLIVGAAEMPDLPPSVLATLASDRSSGGSKQSVSTTVMSAIVPPSDFIIAGEQKIDIVVRN